ncbi:MAG: hypothetical protein JSU77_00110 [Fidelibacterota bacterium]|nr:MAG: hypothetical protein JSU77_00110 [Candidatus Neomarinimicrobiota bacterium]
MGSAHDLICPLHFEFCILHSFTQHLVGEKLQNAEFWWDFAEFCAGPYLPFHSPGGAAARLLKARVLPVMAGAALHLARWQALGKRLAGLAKRL